MVSVIVATRDRPSLLSEALDSLARQTFGDFEVIVSDDGSRDGDAVRAVVQRFPGAKILRADSVRGPGAARNAGIAASSGRYVAILDDDDVARRERLEAQCLQLEREPETDLVCSAVQWFRGEMEPLADFPGVIAGGRWPETPDDVFRLLYLHSNKVPNTTVMAKREVFERFRYPEWTCIGEDWFLFMQMAASGAEIRADTRCLTWQRRDHSISSLVRNRQEFLKAERRVLKEIQAWLVVEGIHRFDGLANEAEANLRARQALWRFPAGGDCDLPFPEFQLIPATWSASARSERFSRERRDGRGARLACCSVVFARAAALGRMRRTKCGKFDVRF